MFNFKKPDPLKKNSSTQSRKRFQLCESCNLFIKLYNIYHFKSFHFYILFIITNNFVSNSNTKLKMDRYIVTSSHTPEECNLAIKHFREYHAGFLTHFEWGCHDNDHNAYAIVEAENHEQAKISVPPFLRHKAKVVKLTSFNLEKTSDNVHDLPK